MWRVWRTIIVGGVMAVGLLLVARTPARAEDLYGYRNYGLGNDYYGGQYYDRDLQYRPQFRTSPKPPPPDFGPSQPYFPHDFRVSGSKWYLFSPRFKAFPMWSGYNDTYPRGTGTEFFYIRPESYY